MAEFLENSKFEKPPRSSPRGKKNCCLTGFILLLIILVVLVGFLIYIFSLAKKIRTGEIKPEELFGQNQNVNLPDGNNLDFILPDPYLGPPEAGVVIEEYSDFQCPACLAAYPVVKELTRVYQGKVKFIYKDFPLIDLHPDALNAALAGQCAHEQGEFWSMHDKLFSNQENLKEVDLKRYAIELGLDSIKFSSCLDSNKYYSTVENDFQEGISRGVNSTPTFFINNKIIKGAVSFEAFEQIIEEELGLKN